MQLACPLQSSNAVAVLEWKWRWYSRLGAIGDAGGRRTAASGSTTRANGVVGDGTKGWERLAAWAGGGRRIERALLSAEDRASVPSGLWRLRIERACCLLRALEWIVRRACTGVDRASWLGLCLVRSCVVRLWAVEWIDSGLGLSRFCWAATLSGYSRYSGNKITFPNFPR